MRPLKFIVDKQIIRTDPACDFDHLVPGSEGYLLAEFSFSPEWNNTVKVVGFYSVFGKEYPPQILKDGRACVIPAEALKKRAFKIQVMGKNDSAKLVTNKLTVYQTGG
jgi:hypothetical protein